MDVASSSRAVRLYLEYGLLLIFDIVIYKKPILNLYELLIAHYGEIATCQLSKRGQTPSTFCGVKCILGLTRT